MTREASGSRANPDAVERSAATAPRHSRRLFDKVLVAFHHACDEDDFQVADTLLGLLEIMTTRRAPAEDTNRRRNMESLVAAHERLWHLRNARYE